MEITRARIPDLHYSYFALLMRVSLRPSPLLVVFFTFVVSLAQAGLQPSKASPLVAVMQLETQGISGQEAALITDAISSRLLASKTCNVMERSQMNEILKEQAFQQSGACDGGSCAVEIGKLLSVDRILVGSVGRIGDAWALNLRLVKVETGEVLRSATGKRKGPIAEAQQALVEQVVGDLTGTGKSNAWKWWTAGGVAVAGGVAAAIILTQEDAQAAPSEGSYKIVWKDTK